MGKYDPIDVTLVTLIGILIVLILSLPFIGAGSFETTVYVVSVDKNQPMIWYENTVITYTDIQPNAVTELDTDWLTFDGLVDDLVPGKYYQINYHKDWNQWHPTLDEVLEIKPNQTPNFLSI